MSDEIEQAVLAYALEHPTHGCLRVAQALALQGHQCSSGGVHRVWERRALVTKHERLLRLEAYVSERKVELTAEQVTLLARFSPEFRERHIETRFTGGLVAVDTFMVGRLKGVGRVYLQTVIDTFSRFCWGQLYPNKMPVTAVHMLNEDVRPAFEAASARGAPVLIDNGREYCGRPDRQPYELFLQLEAIEHRRTAVGRPQSNGIFERMHRTLDEHFRITGRTKRHESIAEMQMDLNTFLAEYNYKRPHQGRGMERGTPAAVFKASLPKRTKKEKIAA